MKKVIMLLAALMCFVAINAQITNTFWGLTLGKSTMADVKRVAAAKGWGQGDREDGTISYSPNKTIKFGGGLWKFVGFRFEGGKLMSVYFSTNEIVSQSVKSQFNSLATSMYEKYSTYADNCSEEDLWFSDDITTVHLGYELFEGFYFCFLNYEDLKLAAKKYKREQGEL